MSGSDGANPGEDGKKKQNEGKFIVVSMHDHSPPRKVQETLHEISKFPSVRLVDVTTGDEYDLSDKTEAEIDDLIESLSKSLRFHFDADGYSESWNILNSLSGFRIMDEWSS